MNLTIDQWLLICNIFIAISAVATFIITLFFSNRNYKNTIEELNNNSIQTKIAQKNNLINQIQNANYVKDKIELLFNIKNSLNQYKSKEEYDHYYYDTFDKCYSLMIQFIYVIFNNDNLNNSENIQYDLISNTLNTFSFVFCKKTKDNIKQYLKKIKKPFFEYIHKKEYLEASNLLNAIGDIEILLDDIGEEIAQLESKLYNTEIKYERNKIKCNIDKL